VKGRRSILFELLLDGSSSGNPEKQALVSVDM
jgi:hypothetical protein